MGIVKNIVRAESARGFAPYAYHRRIGGFSRNFFLADNYRLSVSAMTAIRFAYDESHDLKIMLSEATESSPDAGEI